MHRRTLPTASSGRHSPFRPAPAAPTIGHLLHTFELAIVLEAHAVSRAAAATMPDLRAAHSAFDELRHASEPRGAARWAALEIQFHRALNDLGGNLVLSSLAERTLRDGLTACPILSPDVLTTLQSHHREILRWVEAHATDVAVQHTRTHVLYLRDVLVNAVRGTPRSMVRLHT